MNNQLLHIEDPLKLEFEAIICKKIAMPDDRIGILLDHTYFYPTGGGQEHDNGTIDDVQVIDVFKDGDEAALIHVVDRDIALGPIVARIDADRRLRHMQHHTAQHLLTQCFVRLLNLETVSAHINGYAPSTLDLEAEEIQKTEWEQVENLANTVIYENREVKSYFVAPEDLHKLPLRKPPTVNENIRIVEIDGYDYSACGGTHCPKTGMIGLVKILKIERQNDKIRVHFIAGRQALEYFRSYYDIVTDLASQLSIHPQELVIAFQRQADQLKAVQKELQTSRQERLVFEAQQLASAAQVQDDRRIVLAAYENRPPQELRILADELRRIPAIIALLAAYDGQKISLVAACAEDTGVSAQELLKKHLQRIGGRGGGDRQLAQGGGPATLEQFRTFFTDTSFRYHSTKAWWKIDIHKNGVHWHTTHDAQIRRQTNEPTRHILP